MSILNDNITMLEAKISYLNELRQVERGKPHPERKYDLLCFIHDELKVYEFSLQLLRQIRQADEA
jgi:hypothetical protein